MISRKLFFKALLFSITLLFFYGSSISCTSQLDKNRVLYADTLSILLSKTRNLSNIDVQLLNQRIDSISALQEKMYYLRMPRDIKTSYYNRAKAIDTTYKTIIITLGEIEYDLADWDEKIKNYKQKEKGKKNEDSAYHQLKKELLILKEKANECAVDFNNQEFPFRRLGKEYLEYKERFTKVN